MIELKKIIQFLKYDILDIFGNQDNVYVDGIRPLGEEKENTLNWIGINNTSKQLIADNSKSKVIICDSSVNYSETIKNSGKILIQVKNPKLAIALVANEFFQEKLSAGIHDTAFIHSLAIIHSSSHISANCSIGECTIGANTIIHPNVTIYDGVTIGSNCVIQAGCVIGTDGLGCERKEDGTLVKFPHFGSVLIEDNVEIGANCQIAKGALSNTIIGEGSKINGLCFIAHNCVLGKNVWITGNTMLAGSVKIGDNVTIFSSVIIREQRTIGKSAIIGMGSVVISDVPEGEIWFGNPAKKKQE